MVRQPVEGHIVFPSPQTPPTMPSTPHSGFERSVHEADRLLRKISDELGHPDVGIAYHALRGTLFALRDRLQPDEACDLAAQLPLIIRGIYFDGYRPSGRPMKLDRSAFLQRVQKELDVVRPVNVEKATRAVLSVLSTRISAGEWDQVRNALPADLRPLLPEPALS